MQPQIHGLKNVKKRACAHPPNTSKAVRVEKIAPGSPAAHLGLKPGDLLLNINGKAALNVELADVLLGSKTADYTFYLPQSRETLNVQTQALPLGIRTAPHSDGIVEKYQKQGPYGSEGWFTLWERGDYDHLRLAAQACLKTSLVGKLFGKKTKFAPAEMLIGICDIEDGKLEQGFEALDEFATQMYDWTTDFHGLLYYYRGLNLLRSHNEPRAKELINDALNTSLESDKLLRLARKLELQVIDNDSLMGRNLAVDYPLSYLRGGKGQTTIPELLQTMSDDQVLPLCLMPYYRGNGPYNAALKAYVNIYPHIQTHIHPLVVMTDNKERRKDRAHYFENEDICFKRKLPLQILYESSASFGEVLSLRAAPTFHALKKSGTVVWSGSLDDDYAYWEMINQAQEYD